MNIDITFANIVSLIQLLLFPVVGGVYKMIGKLYRANKLQTFKADALVWAIQKELSNNGFTRAYEDRLEELKDEHKFVDKGI